MLRAEKLAREVLRQRRQLDNDAQSTLTAQGNLAVLLLGRFTSLVERGGDTGDFGKKLQQYSSSESQEAAAVALPLSRIPMPGRLLIEAERLLVDALKSLEQERLRSIRAGAVAEGMLSLQQLEVEALGACASVCVFLKLQF